MTLTLADAMPVLEAQSKLIKQQSIQIQFLEIKLAEKEYNKRYTNTKFKPVAVAKGDLVTIEKRTKK